MAVTSKLEEAQQRLNEIRRHLRYRGRLSFRAAMCGTCVSGQRVTWGMVTIEDRRPTKLQRKRVFVLELRDDAMRFLAGQHPLKELDSLVESVSNIGQAIAYVRAHVKRPKRLVRRRRPRLTT